VLVGIKIKGGKMKKRIVTFCLVFVNLLILSGGQNELWSVKTVFPVSADQQIIFRRPAAIEVFKDRVFVLDSKECVINIISLSGKLITKISKRGQGPGELVKPTAMCIRSNKIYIVDGGKRKVLIFTVGGKFLRSIGLGFNPEVIVFGISVLNDTDRVLLSYYPLDESLKKLFCLGLYSFKKKHFLDQAVAAVQYKKYALRITQNKYKLIVDNNLSVFMVNQSMNEIRKIRVINDKINISNLTLPKEIKGSRIPESEIGFLSRIVKTPAKVMGKIRRYFSAFCLNNHFVFVIESCWDSEIKDFSSTKQMTILNGQDFKFVARVDMPDQIKYFTADENKIFAITEDFEFKIYQLVGN
jgi:hypothetical protein